MTRNLKTYKEFTPLVPGRSRSSYWRSSTPTIHSPGSLFGTNNPVRDVLSSWPGRFLKGTRMEVCWRNVNGRDYQDNVYHRNFIDDNETDGEIHLMFFPKLVSFRVKVDGNLYRRDHVRFFRVWDRSLVLMFVGDGVMWRNRLLDSDSTRFFRVFNVSLHSSGPEKESRGRRESWSPTTGGPRTTESL